MTGQHRNPGTDWVFVPPEPDSPCVRAGCGHPAGDHSAIGERAQVCTVRGCACGGLTVSLQRPNTFLVRPVDADTVRKAIAGIAADAINRAAETLNKIREWCDDADTIVCSHQSEHECVRCEAIKDCAAAIRTLLPDIPPSAGEVDVEQEGTRVTPSDREYPAIDDNHWRN